MLHLAKPALDVALATDRLAPMLDFWRDVAGARFERAFPVGPGQTQHRFDVAGTTLKINHREGRLPDIPPSGYRGLVLARAGLTQPQELTDPDGNRLSLVPPGHDGVHQAAIRLTVRDLAAHRRFYAEALDLAEEAPGRFRIGETLVEMAEAVDAPADAQVVGRGWRYVTIQVMKVIAAHERALAHGAREALPPTAMAGHARYSMIRDPDGNWIELSQRADLAGSID